MSRDVYDKIDFKNPEYTFIYQCAPVLAGLKISNLLILNRLHLKKALELIRRFGLSAYMLYATENKVSILVFNRKKTEEYTMKAENILFLRSCGYGEISVDTILKEIAVKYEGYMTQTSEFPDELGIMLGYPTEDVIGYIENNGKDFLLNGYWKVYFNANEKEVLFKAFDEATEKMIRSLISENDIKPIVNMYNAGSQLHSEKTG